MRNFVLGCSVLLLAFTVFTGTMIAHHSFAAEFDREQQVSLTGIVTKVEWTNPHVWFYINVTDPETGEVTNWGAEMGPPHGLQARGWRRDTLKIGMKVTLPSASLARNGSNRVNAGTVQMTDIGGSPYELDANSSAETNP
jgi:hypothetical protein